MKKTISWCACALIALAGAAPGFAAAAGESVESAVKALEYQWLESQKKNDAGLVAPLLADGMVSTGEDGKVEDKAAMLAEMKATKFTGADYEDVKVAVFGDTAIATGGWRGKGTDPTGKAFESHVRWTDTWVKMPGGKWQCVATQSTPIK